MPPPPPAPEPPPVLERVAPGWTAELAYRLVPDLTTWRLTDPTGVVRFAKVATGERCCYPTLRGESERMVWAAPYLPVPEVVALEEVEEATVLVTEALSPRTTSIRPASTRSTRI